ncbi:flagellar type III secretion system protein FliR [Pectobacterium brasiliense]|uniref:Flagellar biosynthetic protein FliR n=1 Tax=Pectobacterium brasiliense TaxID=180957 RepID=A0A433N6U0_9GAMM|nr:MULTISPECIES: flagellar biosynthetic protein FliR [Pectobacterium]GKV99117.1 flagellar biosynthetic protein FliR [Pectobacterium carotovorum subsp. carotovorum]AFR04095.1 flagellar biosynthetic protein FliR [Pectobacterium carotovorum subsp. carotovorum PCC21]APS30661.1 flagellar biosynthesis protein FliR [Pectobacterium brasiliense]ARA75890.1 flagellar biosynthetic protein FliR [Pectobacterium brasiliense]KFF67922.1 flagellar biosynthesis protein FliR [Pectobacterium brasiliense]
MLTFNSWDMVNWVSQFFWPFVRILALISTAPVFNERAIGNRVKIGLGALITLLVAPYLPLNTTPIFSVAGVWLLIQQILIGVTLGLSMQLAFAAIRHAGELIGLQMGLAFATFFDPTGGPNMQVVARFLNILAILLFLTFDGHLWMISLLADSFYTLPISANPINSHAFLALARAGGLIFINGLMLALPIITLLLTINLALGMLNRVAPQLSVFVVGFPITLTVGIMTLGLLLPLVPPFAEHLFSEVFDLLADILTQLASS